jgi:hypothetical protein
MPVVAQMLGVSSTHFNVMLNWFLHSEYLLVAVAELVSKRALLNWDLKNASV